MSDLKIERKRNDREPVTVRVTFPATTDLTSVPVVFWMDAEDGSPKIEGSEATAADITPGGGAEKTVWLLSYAFDGDDLDTVGTFKGEFEADFGADQKRYYPLAKTNIAVKVLPHPATD